MFHFVLSNPFVFEVKNGNDTKDGKHYKEIQDDVHMVYYLMSHATNWRILTSSLSMALKKGSG